MGERSFFCEEFLAQPAALRSRFSVVMLPLEEVLQQRLRSFSAQQQARVQNALERCEDLVRRLKPEADGGEGLQVVILRDPENLVSFPSFLLSACFLLRGSH